MIVTYSNFSSTTIGTDDLILPVRRKQWSVGSDLKLCERNCTCISSPHNSTIKNEANEKPDASHDLSPVKLLWERVI